MQPDQEALAFIDATAYWVCQLHCCFNTSFWLIFLGFSRRRESRAQFACGCTEREPCKHQNHGLSRPCCITSHCYCYFLVAFWFFDEPYPQTLWTLLGLALVPYFVLVLYLFFFVRNTRLRAVQVLCLLECLMACRRCRDSDSGSSEEAGNGVDQGIVGEVEEESEKEREVALGK